MVVEESWCCLWSLKVSDLLAVLTAVTEPEGGVALLGYSWAVEFCVASADTFVVCLGSREVEAHDGVTALLEVPLLHVGTEFYP